jgi:hypothetical protein
MATPVSQARSGLAAGNSQPSNAQPPWQPKDKTLLEQAEELLDRASKELRAMREENERLRQKEIAYEYLKQMMDMARPVPPFGGAERAIRDTAFDIDDWVKGVQEKRLRGVLGAPEENK